MLGIFPRLIEMFKIVLSLGFTKYGTPSDFKKNANKSAKIVIH